jgi:hypothetical protein
MMVKEKNKIVVSYNESQVNVNLKTLQDNANRYNTYIDAVLSITGSSDFKTLSQIEQYIKDATSFSNVERSAELLDCIDAYNYIKANYLRIDLSLLDIDTDGIASTKPSAIAQVKEDATEYLKEEFINEYEVLLNACNALNKLNNPNSSQYLKRAYDGLFSVNLQMLQNSNRM